MSEHDRHTLLEERLRRDAARMRAEDTAPELVARVVAALDERGVSSGPGAGRARGGSPSGSARRWLRAAAVLLVVLGAWAVLRQRAVSPPLAPPLAPELAAVASVEPGGSAAPRPAAEGRARTGTQVATRVRGWARSSSVMLRESVDDPLRRELKALSLDFVRMIDAVVIGLPEALAKPFETLF